MSTKKPLHKFQHNPDLLDLNQQLMSPSMSLQDSRTHLQTTDDQQPTAAMATLFAPMSTLSAINWLKKECKSGDEMAVITALQNLLLAEDPDKAIPEALKEIERLVQLAISLELIDAFFNDFWNALFVCMTATHHDDPAQASAVRVLERLKGRKFGRVIYKRVSALHVSAYLHSPELRELMRDCKTGAGVPLGGASTHRRAFLHPVSWYVHQASTCQHTLTYLVPRTHPRRGR